MTLKITTRAEQSIAPRFYCCALCNSGTFDTKVHIVLKHASNEGTFDRFTNTPSVTSLDPTFSLSEWSRPAKLSQAACRLLKVGGDRMSAEG